MEVLHRQEYPLVIFPSCKNNWWLVKDPHTEQLVPGLGCKMDISINGWFSRYVIAAMLADEKKKISN